MTVIVDEDFENWNVNSWLIYYAGVGTQIIYAGEGRNGSNGMYFETSKQNDANNKQYIYRYPTAMDDLTLTAYIRVHSLTLGLNPCYTFIYVEDGSAGLAQYMVGFKKIGGVPCFVAYSGATNTYYELQTITYDQWYKITLIIKRHATNGYDKLYIDNILVVDNSGINTELVGGGGMDGFYFGMVYGTTVWEFYMDDILIENNLPPCTNWYELFSDFEDGSFTADDWYSDADGWGFDIVDTQFNSGTHSAEPHCDEQGGLMHDLDCCTPTGFYALRLWFKIVGTVPTGVGGSILVRLFMSDASEVQLYIETGNLGNPATPKLRLDFKTSTVRGTTAISLNIWHCLHIHQEVLNGTAKTDIYLDSLITPEITLTKNMTGVNVVTIELQPEAWCGFGGYTGRTYIDTITGSCDLDEAPPLKDTSPICTDPIFKLYIDENDPPTTLRDCMNIHYTKSHPNQDPDTFEIIVDSSVGVLINYFDRVKITKYDVNEFYGFVEEITPTVGEDGLEYRLTGRCWKLILWKKWSERYQESREIGPVDSEGNIESGFFGQVKPEELIKFILRCPISEHPKGKVRQKIGWGIASDFWSCCANATADMFYPDWVGLRYTGLSWRGYASVETLHYSNLVCNAFDSTYLDWTEVGASPYLHTDSTADQIKTGTPPWGQKEGLFGFADLGGTAETIYTVKLYVKAMVQGYSAKISVHLYDGASTYNIGYLNACPYGYGYTEFNCIAILDTPTKVNNAKIYFEMETGYHALVGVIYAYLHVEYSDSTDADIYQKTDDWFVVNLGAAHDDVTAILIECRNNPLMYARNYKIQYCTISNCCVEGHNDGFWSDFDPVINEVNNDVRDILHSWKPQDDVFGIRIKLTADAIYPWEISQIYIWQSDTYKYRVLNEGD